MRPSRQRCLVPLSRRQVRIAVGVLWLVDAGLQAQPALFTAEWWRSDLAQSVMGQPPEINHSIFAVINIIAAHAAMWNTAFVAVQVALGASLVLGRFERATIIASIPWAIGIWWVGEGFGTLPTGFAMAAAGSPGPVVFYPLLVLLAWPRTQPPTPDYQSNSDTSVTIRWRNGATAWVVLWAGQALLQIPWVFPSRQTLVANIQESSQSQPGWMQTIAHATETLAQHHPSSLTIALAVAQVTIGVGALNPMTRRAALSAGIALSVMWWFAFQYLGGIAGGDATDPGTAPLLILLAVALWPRAASDMVPRAVAETPQRASRFTFAPRPPPRMAQ